MPKLLRNLGTAALASMLLGGCAYGDVYGASSYATYDCAARYGDEYWSNDPYAYDNATYGYDCYDAADYHAGFAQIGFGGGWHQNLYYPGYGLFLFDRYGRRHSMSHDYLTYWGGRRAWHKHHGRHGYKRGKHDRGDGSWSGGHQPGRGYNRDDDSDEPRRRPRRDGRGWTPPTADGVPPVTATRPVPRTNIPPRSEGNGARPRRDSGRWTPPAADGGAPVGAARPVPRTNIPPRGNGNAGAAASPRAAQPVRVAPAPRAAPPPPVQQRGNAEANIKEN